MSRSSSEQRERENHPRVFKKNLTEKRKYEENDVIKYHKAYFSSILLLERRAEIARKKKGSREGEFRGEEEFCVRAKQLPNCANRGLSSAGMFA